MGSATNEALTDEEKKILSIFKTVIPNLTPVEKARILGWSEGIAFKTHEMQEQETGRQPHGKVLSVL